MDSSIKGVVEEKCDRCEKSFTAEVWQIVDSIERPDLVEQIANNTIRQVICPHCQHQQQTKASLLFTRRNELPSFLFASSTKNLTQERYERDADKILKHLAKIEDDYYKISLNNLSNFNWVLIDQKLLIDLVNVKPFTQEKIALNQLYQSSNQIDCYCLINSFSNEFRQSIYNFIKRKIGKGNLDKDKIEALALHRAIFEQCLQHNVEKVFIENIYGINEAPLKFCEDYKKILSAHTSLIKSRNRKDFDVEYQFWQDLLNKLQSEHCSFKLKIHILLERMLSEAIDKFNELNHIEKAINICNQIIETTKGNIDYQILSLHKKGNHFISKYKVTLNKRYIDKSIECWNQANSIFSNSDKIKDFFSQGILFNNIAASLIDLFFASPTNESLDLSIEFCNQAIKHQNKNGLSLDYPYTNLGNAFRLKFVVYEDENYITSAINAYETSIQYIPEDNIERKASLYIMLADTLVARCNLKKQIDGLERAIDSYQQALIIAKKSNFSIGLISDILFSLGKAFAQKGLYQDAILKLDKCCQLQSQIKNISKLAATLFELARLHHHTGRLEQSRLYFKDTLRLFRRIKNKEKIAAVLTALGNLEMQTGKLNQACKHLQEAREYYQQKEHMKKLKEVDKLLKLLPDNNIAEKV